MLRLPRFVAILLAFAIVLSGCAGNAQPAAPAETSTPVDGGTLTRAMTSEPVTIDPHGAANSGLNLILPYIFDTLVTRQRDGKLVGLLAEDWQTSEDGKVLEFKLKSGVTFHDGTPLTADAVVFTFERFKEVGDKSPIISSIRQFETVEAVDELTVRFTFAQPTATFISALAMPHAGILSPSAVEAAGEEMGRKPVGTGPFKFADWQSGVSITLERNPDYQWGTPEAENRGPVKFERLVFKVVPDPSTQLSALQAGEVDVLFVNEPSHMAKFENDESVRMEMVDLDSLIYLGYNCAKAHFDDARVRRALNHTVNRAEIIETALGGLGEEAFTPLTPSMLGYDESLKAYGQEYDPAKTKALLIEAGFTQAADGTWERDGQKLAGKLLTSTRAPNEAIATVLQSQLQAVGVPVEIQQLDSAAVMAATSEGAFDLLLWRYEWNDPDALNMFLSTSRIRSTNRSFYSNPQADELFEQGLRELDEEKRKEIYIEAQKIILTDAPWQPLYIPVEAMIVRDRVQGLKVGALGRMLVNDVTIVER